MRRCFVKEVWKDIKGFEGLYAISNKGNVKSLKSGKILKPYDNDGYYRITLNKGGKSKRFLVHVLVVIHFIGDKPFKNAQINHKDLNKHNNCVTNLEWVTPSDNVKHAIKNIKGRAERLKADMRKIGKKYGHLGIEASKKPVVQIDKDTGKIIAVYESAREAYKQTGVNYKGISSCCNEKKKTYGGYKWAFYVEGVTTIESTSEKDGSE